MIREIRVQKTTNYTNAEGIASSLPVVAPSARSGIKSCESAAAILRKNLRNLLHLRKSACREAAY